MDATTLDTPNGAIQYPAKLLTVAQTEEQKPALKGRVRGMILRADLNSPDYAGLKDAVIRIGRSVYIDEVRFDAWLRTHAGRPPERPRNPDGKAGKKERRAGRRTPTTSAKPTPKRRGVGA